MYCTLEIWNKWWNHWFHVSHEITGFTGPYFDYPTLENSIANPWSGITILIWAISVFSDQAPGYRFVHVSRIVSSSFIILVGLLIGLFIFKKQKISRLFVAFEIFFNTRRFSSKVQQTTSIIPQKDGVLWVHLFGCVHIAVHVDLYMYLYSALLSEERLQTAQKGCCCMRNGSVAPRKEGFAKRTQVMLLGGGLLLTWRQRRTQYR